MYRKVIKPFIDITAAIILLIILLPILLLVALLIKIDSPGPVLFTQDRLGYKYRVFKVYKFRTMTNKVRTVHKQVFDGDPEVTTLGKYLRRFKIDELPQLFNILAGDMSLVGPRPSLPNLQEKFDENGHYRVKVKPGVTNLAAVNGSIFLTWPERWVYDRKYVENLSFWLDIEVMFKTLVVVVMGEDFYLKKKKHDNQSGN